MIAPARGSFWTLCVAISPRHGTLNQSAFSRSQNHARLLLNLRRTDPTRLEDTIVATKKHQVVDCFLKSSRVCRAMQQLTAPSPRFRIGFQRSSPRTRTPRQSRSSRLSFEVKTVTRRAATLPPPVGQPHPHRSWQLYKNRPRHCMRCNIVCTKRDRPSFFAGDSYACRKFPYGISMNLVGFVLR